MITDPAVSPRLINRSLLTPLPGVLLVAALALLAQQLQRATGLAWLNPMMLAIVLGIVIRWRLLPPGRRGALRANLRPGLALAQRPMMRFAIVLLGLQLSLQQLSEAGVGLFAGLALLLVATLGLSLLLGPLLGVGAGLSRLIGAGTAICGASAILAVQAARPSSGADMGYAIACVTLFGTLSMLGLPLLAQWLALDPQGFGLWAGASLHEVAQVAGATGPSGGAAQWGMVAKLSRVMMLAPMVIALSGFGGFGGASGRGAAAPLPWFVLGFVALMLLNSMVALPTEVVTGSAQIAGFLLTMALAAIGLETDLSALRQKGWRPLLLAALLTLFVTLGAAVLLGLLGYL